MSSYSDIDTNNYCVLGICGSRARKELSHSVIVSYIDSCFAICKLRVYRYMLINQLIISSSVLSSLLQFCPSEKHKVDTCLRNCTGFEIRKCNELIWRIRIIIIQFKVSIKEEKALHPAPLSSSSITPVYKLCSTLSLHPWLFVVWARAFTSLGSSSTASFSSSW